MPTLSPVATPITETTMTAGVETTVAGANALDAALWVSPASAHQLTALTAYRRLALRRRSDRPALYRRTGRADADETPWANGRFFR